MKKNLIKFVVSALCIVNMLYGVSNKRSSYNDDQFLQDILRQNMHIYKGCGFINQYGWFITQKWEVPLRRFEFEGKYYDVKYYPHESLDFAIFKIDSRNDAQKDQFLKLEFLASKEDLEKQYNWVNSYTIFPNLLYTEDDIIETEIANSKPWFGISKIEARENGYLKLGLGGDFSAYHQQMWPNIKDNYIKKSLKNYKYLGKVLKDSNTKSDFLRAYVSENSRTINYLIRRNNTIQKQLHSLIDQKKRFNNLINIKNTEVKIKLLQDKMLFNQKELSIFLSNDEIKIWEYMKTKIEKERIQLLNVSYNVHNISNIYTNVNLQQKKHVLGIVNTYFSGVADKKDKGGLILVDANKLTFKNNQYGFNELVAGITWFKKDDDFVEGETSIAIDLTTPEVHQWVSDTIDAHYARQETTNNMIGEKRSADDESGPSDNTKRVRLKQESIENNFAIRSSNINNSFPIKEEFKQETKEEK